MRKHIAIVLGAVFMLCLLLVGCSPEKTKVGIYIEGVGEGMAPEEIYCSVVLNGETEVEDAKFEWVGKWDNQDIAIADTEEIHYDEYYTLVTFSVPEAKSVDNLELECNCTCGSLSDVTMLSEGKFQARIDFTDTVPLLKFNISTPKIGRKCADYDASNVAASFGYYDVEVLSADACPIDEESGPDTFVAGEDYFISVVFTVSDEAALEEATVSANPLFKSGRRILPNVMEDGKPKKYIITVSFTMPEVEEQCLQVSTPVPDADADVFYFRYATIDLDGEEVTLAGDVKWFDKSGKELEDGDKFVENATYTAEVPIKKPHAWKDAKNADDVPPYTVETRDGIEFVGMETVDSSTFMIKLTSTVKVDEDQLTHKHNFDGTDEYGSRPASCRDGYVIHVCACGARQYELVKGTGKHEINQEVGAVDVKARTCTEDGYVTYECKYCGTEIKEEDPATGHDFQRTGGDAPDCTHPGHKVYVCTICTEEKVEEVPPSHNWSIYDYFSDGMHMVICSECDETKMEKCTLGFCFYNGDGTHSYICEKCEQEYRIVPCNIVDDRCSVGPHESY